MAADSLDSALGLLGHLPEGSLVIIKDSLHASGSFLLHHYLSKLLSTSKAGNETRAAGASTNVRTLELANDSAQAEALNKAACRVCLVAFDQTFSHYASVGRKLGTNLNAKLDEGVLSFIDCVSKPYEWRSNTPSKTKALVNEVSEGLHNITVKPNVNPVKEAPSASAPSEKPKPGTLEVESEGAPSKSAQMLSSSSRKQSSQPVAPSPLTFTCHLTISEVSGARSSLQSLMDQLTASVQTFRQSEAGYKRGVTILFDDLGGPEAACQSSASDVLALLNCSRRLRSQSGQRASVVALIHADILPDTQKGLATTLEHTADLVLQVDPLATGSAADIHGQLSITQRTNRWRTKSSEGVASPSTSRFSRQQKFQFRLLETGVKLIHIGGSKGGA